MASRMYVSDIEHNIYKVNLETFNETLVVYNWSLEENRI